MRCKSIACLLVLVSSGAVMAQEPGDEPPPRWWGGLGLGYGYVDASAPPAPSGEGGMWVELQGGFRVGEHWLLGLEVSAVGFDISESNYDPNDEYSTVFGQNLSNAFLLVQYAPTRDRGWLFSAGAGQLIYDSRAIRQITHEDQNGKGTAALLRASYDWRFGHAGHYGIDLSYEYGDVELASPFDSKFDVSMFMLGFHYTYR